MMKEAPISIWVGNLKAYNEGELEGEWLNLPMKEKDLWEKIGTIIKNPDEEELFIADLDLRKDCMYMQNIISEWSSIKDINTVAELIGDEKHPKVEAYLENASSLSIPQLANILLQEEEIPFYRYEFEGSNDFELMERLTPEEKMGYTILDEPQTKELLMNTSLGEDILYNYIDVEAVGRDAGINSYSLTEEGYLDMKKSDLDLNLYTMKEIREEIREQEQVAEEQKEKMKQQKPDISPSL